MSTEPSPIENSVGCLIFRHKHNSFEVLLLQKLGTGKNYWAIPDLPVSDDEDFEAAARNYVQGLTGAKHAEASFLGYVSYPKRRLNCYYSEAPVSGKLNALDIEIGAAEFMSFEKAADLIDKRQQLLLGSLRATLMFRDTA